VNPAKGALFGDNGALKMLDILPKPSIPIPFAGSIPMNLGMWLIFTGIVLWIVTELE